MRRTILPESNSVLDGVGDSSICSCGDTNCKYRNFGAEAVKLLKADNLTNSMGTKFSISRLAKKHDVDIEWLNGNESFIAVDKGTTTETYKLFIGVKRHKSGKIEVRVKTHDVDFKVVRT